MVASMGGRALARYQEVAYAVAGLVAIGAWHRND